MRRITISIADKQYDKLKNRSRLFGLDIEELIINAIRLWILLDDEDEKNGK